MNTLKSIFKYFNSKLLYLILIVGLPAVLAGTCITGKGFMDLMLHFGDYHFASFIDVYMKLLSRQAKWLYLQPIAFVGLALGLSLLYATIDSHMRMGEFNIRNVVRKIDYNFLASIKFILVVAFTGHILTLLLATLIFLFYKISFNLGLAWTLTIISTLLFGLIYISIFTMLILWLPTMLHTGAGANRAFIMSAKQIAPVFFKVMFSLLLPAIPYCLLISLDSFYGWGISAVFDALNFAIFSIWLVITMNTWYYDLNNIEREDLKTFTWSKKY